MYKKIILLSLVAQTISLQSSDNNTPAKKGINWWKASPTYWMFGNIPVAHANDFIKVPVSPADRAGGLTSDNYRQVSENALKIVDLAISDPKKMEDTSYGTSHGFVQGVIEAPFHSAQKGATWTKETICQHPWAFSSAVAGLGVVAASIHYVSENFPSREETARRALLERQEAENKRETETIAAECKFRTCINTHFRSMEREDRIPKQCHSPARKMNILNAARASAMVDAANKFRD